MCVSNSPCVKRDTPQELILNRASGCDAKAVLNGYQTPHTWWKTIAGTGERDATHIDGVNRWISRVIQRASFFLFSFGPQEIVFIVIYLTNVEMRNSLYNNTEKKKKKKKRCSLLGDVYGDRFFGGSKDALSYSSDIFFFLACPFR